MTSFSSKCTFINAFGYNNSKNGVNIVFWGVQAR